MNLRSVLAGVLGALTSTTTTTSGAAVQVDYCSAPCVPGDESIMSRKEHGTSHVPVQEKLRWGCNRETADRICNYNRHYAEYAEYFTETTFLADTNKTSSTKKNRPIEFFDSNTGKLLFAVMPNSKDRSYDDFVTESKHHGWPSFRDSEVNWDYVRVLPNGETVSVDGTHLGHNLPDRTGNRYCINLVSVAGNPNSSSSSVEDTGRRNRRELR